MAVVDPVAGLERIKAKREARKAAIAADQQAAVERREQAKQAMREAMPEVAGVVDQVKTVFGEDCRVLVAEEGGKRVAVSAARFRALGLSDE